MSAEAGARPLGAMRRALKGDGGSPTYASEAQLFAPIWRRYWGDAAPAVAVALVELLGRERPTQAEGPIKVAAHVAPIFSDTWGDEGVHVAMALLEELAP